MKITVKYKVLFYNGKKGSKKFKYECPDFEDIHYNFLGRKSTETAVSQADKWLEDVDKASWMEGNDIDIIFDWTIVSAIKNGVELVIKEEKIDNRKVVEYWVKELSGMDEGFQNEFEAVYSEMYEKVKNMSASNQISVTLRATGVALQAAATAYKHITDYSASLKNKSLEELRLMTGNKPKEICSE